MSKLTRSVAAVVTVAAILALALVAVSAAKPRARADSGTAYVAITHTVGGLDYAAGNNVDAVLGQGAVTYVIKTGVTQGKVTITSKHVVLYSGTGSLSGTASAVVTVTGTTEKITGGKLTLTTGAGSLRAHSLKATFTGSGSAASGQYVFHYKGTFR